MTIVTRDIDELSREEWTFQVYPYRTTAGLVLTHYGIARRKRVDSQFMSPQPRDRWDSLDERGFHSGLGRPIHIPQDVIDEAKRDALRYVFIGWASEPAMYQGRK